MTNYHLHGKSPFSIVAVHGGPGAPGSLCSLASALSSGYGVLEPFQTKSTVSSLVDEMRETIKTYATQPVVLIGHSWGAWLSLVFASSHPLKVSKVILISSGPFSESFVPEIEKRRLACLSYKEKNEFSVLVNLLEADSQGSSVINKNAALRRLAELVAKSDYYDSVDSRSDDEAAVRVEGGAYSNIWKEAAEMRKSGLLLSVVRKVGCPVVAIHGEHDPHPADGVSVIPPV
jgi:pimeloyl-ACP methyl ester carboxylesterase